MLPKPEEVINQIGNPFQEIISDYMREYGRRLLDHVAEKCTDDWGNGFTLIEQDEIIKIKDEL